jgi:uncharacterized phage protein gp47/JayE
MPINYPVNRKEVSDRVKTDIQNELPESDPFLRNSYIGAVGVGCSGAEYDLYKTIQNLQVQLFPDTATGEFADRWGAFKGVYRNPASHATGTINITGSVGSLIPAGSQLQTAAGLQYTTVNEFTLLIAAKSLATSLARSGSIVTATTVDNHDFASGNSITIAGANQTEYNGTFVITVTESKKFTYTITGTPVTPATGTITSSLNCVACPIVSVSAGFNTNMASGSELIFSSLLAGIDSSAYVTFDGIAGGDDVESDTDYRNRYIYAYQNPISFFNDAAIITTAMQVPGVTRVFVQDNTPGIGQVTIYFTRDNDSYPIPDPAEVIDIQNKIETIRPATVNPSNIKIYAPTPVLVDFVFSTLDPDTSTMKSAITESLKALFAEVPIVGQSLSQYSYQSAIYQTVDPSSGKFVTSFSLSDPIGDIAVGAGGLAIFNSITFP